MKAIRNYWPAVALLLVALLVWPQISAQADGRAPVAVAGQEAVAETLEVDILSADLQPRRVGAYRIGVKFGTEGTFSIVIKDEDGSVLDEVTFNGSALAAGGGHTFTWPVRPSRKYNFQTTASGTVTIYVDEIHGGEL